MCVPGFPLSSCSRRKSWEAWGRGYLSYTWQSERHFCVHIHALPCHSWDIMLVLVVMLANAYTLLSFRYYGNRSFCYEYLGEYKKWVPVLLFYIVWRWYYTCTTCAIVYSVSFHPLWEYLDFIKGTLYGRAILLHLMLTRVWESGVRLAYMGCHPPHSLFCRALQDALAALHLEPNWPKGYFRKARALCGLKVHSWCVVLCAVSLWLVLRMHTTLYMCWHWIWISVHIVHVSVNVLALIERH